MEIFKRYIFISLLLIPSYFILFSLCKLYGKKVSSSILYRLWKMVLCAFGICNILLFFPSMSVKILEPTTEVVVAKSGDTIGLLDLFGGYGRGIGVTPSNINGSDSIQFEPIWIFYFILIVGLILVLYMIWKNYTFNRNLKDLKTDDSDSDYFHIRDSLKREFGIKRDVQIFLIEDYINPFCYGFFNPKIVVSSILNYTDEEKKLLLKHEIIHYKKNDIWIKLLSNILRCLHWFNPFIYLIGRQIDKYSEWSCDEQVINSEKKNILPYGNLILKHCKCSVQMNYVQTIGLNRNFDLIKERIINMKISNKKNSRLLPVVAVVLSILTISLSGCMTIDEKDKSTNSQEVVFDEPKVNAENDLATEQLETDDEKIGDDNMDITTFDNFAGFITEDYQATKSGVKTASYDEYFEQGMEYFGDLTDEEIEEISNKNLTYKDVNDSIYSLNAFEFIKENNLGNPLKDADQNSAPYVVWMFLEMGGQYYGSEQWSVFFPADENIPVYSVSDGKVDYVNAENNSVRIRYGDYLIKYFMISCADIREGQEIKEGDLIGYTIGGERDLSIIVDGSPNIDYDKTKIDTIINDIVEGYKNGNVPSDIYEKWPTDLIKIEDIVSDGEIKVIPLSDDGGIGAQLTLNDDGTLFMVAIIEVYNDYNIVNVSFSISG